MRGGWALNNTAFKAVKRGRFHDPLSAFADHAEIRSLPIHATRGAGIVIEPSACW